MAPRIIAKRITQMALVTVTLGACNTGLWVNPFYDPIGSSDADSRAEASDARDHVSAPDAGDATETTPGDGALPDANEPFDHTADQRDAGADSDDSSDRPVDGSDGDVINMNHPDGADGDAPVSERDADVPETIDVDGCVLDCDESADYYVDAHAEPGGDGSRLRPFRTITAAIDAYAQEPIPSAKRVKVAAGMYDGALGERFPLVLRGLSISGAGQDKTFLVGTGIINHAAAGGSMNGTYSVTIVAGDSVLPTRISGLSLRPSSPIPTTNYHGVLCDRGSGGGLPSAPAGQTVLDRINAGPGYHATISAATSTAPTLTGCNLQVTRSTLTGGWLGLYADGCRYGVGRVPVMVEMGTAEPDSGNTISSMQGQLESAFSVLVQSCVTRGTFQHNTVVDGVHGIAVDQGEDPVTPRHPFRFVGNSFARLVAGAIATRAGGPIYIEEVTDNTFVDISRAVEVGGDPAAPPAVALWADLNMTGKVRNNRFIGNDSAIWFDVGPVSTPAADLGTVADPGNNVFRCNSGVTGTGADIWLVGWGTPPATNWSGTLHLAGNSWDHAPPTINLVDPSLDGHDIVARVLPGMTFDVANALVATSTACPSNRVAGP